MRKNPIHVERAQKVLDHYQALESDMLVGPELFRDLLTDFRHWADANGIDFHDRINASYEVYLEEIVDD